MISVTFPTSDFDRFEIHTYPSEPEAKANEHGRFCGRIRELGEGRWLAVPRDGAVSQHADSCEATRAVVLAAMLTPERHFGLAPNFMAIRAAPQDL